MSPAPYRPAGQHVRGDLGALEAQAALLDRLAAQLVGYGAHLAGWDARGRVLGPGYYLNPGGRTGGHVRYVAVPAGGFRDVWGAGRDLAHDGRMREAVEAAARLLARDGWRLSTIEPPTPRADSYAPGFLVEAGPQEKEMQHG